MTRDRRRASSNDVPPDQSDGPAADADVPVHPAGDGALGGTRTCRPGPPPLPERYAFDDEGDGVVVYDRERPDAWIKSDYALAVGHVRPDDPSGD